jgi:hypothetical protein
VLVHRKSTAVTYDLGEITHGKLGDCRTQIRIDSETGNALKLSSCNGMLTFAGYGVAVVTNAVVGHDIDLKSE